MSIAEYKDLTALGDILERTDIYRPKKITKFDDRFEVEWYPPLPTNVWDAARTFIRVGLAVIIVMALVYHPHLVPW